MESGKPREPEWAVVVAATVKKRAVAGSGLGRTGLVVDVHFIRQAIQPPIVSSSPNGVTIFPLHSILIADGPAISVNGQTWASNEDEDGFI